MGKKIINSISAVLTAFIFVFFITSCNSGGSTTTKAKDTNVEQEIQTTPETPEQTTTEKDTSGKCGDGKCGDGKCGDGKK